MSDRKYTREQMLDKIQKLMAVADDPNANEHVAAQMGAKAQELMQQWAIQENELATASGKAPKFVSVGVPYLDKKPQPWEGALAVHVARAMMTHVFTSARNGAFYVCGQETDVEVASYVFAQLQHNLPVMAKRALSAHAAEQRRRFGKSIYNVKQCYELSGCHPTVYRSRWLDSWLTGAVEGVAVQLARQAQTTGATSSTALVVVETRRQLAEDWATEEFNLRPGKSKARKHFDDAKACGRADGEKIQIRKGLGEADKPKQLH